MTNEKPIDIGVAIGTFGDEKWVDLAQQRAIPSVEAQTVEVPYVAVHDETLAKARNSAIEYLGTEFVIVLDADDELDPHYVAAMSSKARTLDPGIWMLQPATLGIVDGAEDEVPVIIRRAQNLLDRNHLVIGTMFQAEPFFRVGGFRELPILDDWDLWIRLWLEGGKSISVPEAIYRVHINPSGRNNQAALQQQYYQEIRDEYMPKARAKGLV